MPIQDLSQGISTGLEMRLCDVPCGVRSSVFSCKLPLKCPGVFVGLLPFAECSGTLNTDIHPYLLFCMRFESLVGKKPNELCPHLQFRHVWACLMDEGSSELS